MMSKQGDTPLGGSNQGGKFFQLTSSTVNQVYPAADLRIAVSYIPNPNNGVGIINTRMIRTNHTKRSL